MVMVSFFKGVPLGGEVFWCSGIPGFTTSGKDLNNLNVVVCVAFHSVYWFRNYN